MKILAVNNTVMLGRPDGIFIYRANAKFLIELARRVEKLEFFQFLMKSGAHDSIADFNILDRGFDITAVKRGRTKLVPYIKAFWTGFWRIRACDFLYLYYPGNICIVLALIAILQRKPFGLYVRGQHGIGSRISRFLYRRAVVSLTISPEFTGRIRRAGGNAETVRPMMEVGEEDIVADRVYAAKAVYSLLSVGRIVADKGSFDLVAALKVLADRGIRRFRLDVVGDGPDAAALMKQAADLGLSDVIAFHGPIMDRGILKTFFREADLFVLPTHHEGFPRVLYEAMIAGLPILTTPVGTIPALMKDGVNCYHFPPKDPARLAARIAEVLEDYPNKAAVAVEGTRTIREYLRDKPETHARQLTRILAEKGIS